jgi:hypothetical protein
MNRSGSENGGKVKKASLLLPHQRGVEALLDRRPDGEHRRERNALDPQVAARPDVDVVDLVEQVLGRVRDEHLHETRTDADSEECEPVALAPRGIHRELLVTQHATRRVVRVRRVGLGHADGGVHVVGTGGERAEEHRHHEARVDSVHHQVHAVLPGECLHGARI